MIIPLKYYPPARSFFLWFGSDQSSTRPIGSCTLGYAMSVGRSQHESEKYHETRGQHSIPSVRPHGTRTATPCAVSERSPLHSKDPPRTPRYGEPLDSRTPANASLFGGQSIIAKRLNNFPWVTLSVGRHNPLGVKV